LLPFRKTARQNRLLVREKQHGRFLIVWQQGNPGVDSVKAKASCSELSGASRCCPIVFSPPFSGSIGSSRRGRGRV
jgi:hypothetical protein